MIYLGIDPGASGGLVALLPDGEVRFTTMPKTEQGIWRWLDEYSQQDGRGCGQDAVAVIEQVQGYIGRSGSVPKDQVDPGLGQPGSAMFKFGQSYGGLRMALTAADIPFTAVTPQAWQKALGILPRERTEDRGRWKQRLKAEAQRLYPRLKLTLATSDALLIANYCKLIHERKVEHAK